jgi:Flp pilus assembly protein TadG
MLRRLARRQDGIAMVEFAIVLPVMLTMFLGCYVISDMIACYRKVTITTRALTDLVSRNISPSSGTNTATITTYLNSADLVLSPFSTANATLQISQLRICDATHAYVVWSQAQTGATTATASLTAGSVVAVPAKLITTPMVPVSPDGTNVCSNTTGTSTKTQVGTAGAYLFFGQVSYKYVPAITYAATITTTTMADQIYMSPRLN